MYGRAETAQVAVAWTGFFGRQLGFGIRGAAFRVDGVTNG
jgi:hypothetical protein